MCMTMCWDPRLCEDLGGKGCCAYLQVLLGYLSCAPEEWDQLLARRRTEYHVFCDVGRVFVLVFFVPRPRLPIISFIAPCEFVPARHV